MIEKPLLERARSLFIGGEWRSPTAPQSITAVDPSTGGVLARIDGGRQVGQKLLFVIRQLVDAVRKKRDRDRAARGASRRIDRDVDGVGEAFALAAALVELILVGAPDVGVGVAAEVAFAVDQYSRNSLQQELLDET